MKTIKFAEIKSNYKLLDRFYNFSHYLCRCICGMLLHYYNNSFTRDKKADLDDTVHDAEKCEAVCKKIFPRN